ncbi:MAG: amidase [Thiotrichales bacterium]|nr:amidase [Thiotrichales bacterium]
MSVLLEVKALRAGYGRGPVLHGVDFEVEEGEVVGVLGHNGMGKTTLLKTIMGIVPAAGGMVGYAGLDLTRERASERARRGIGYVPQGRGIFPNLSVRDNIRMGLAAHDDDEEGAIRRVLVEFPQLEPLLDRNGGALSGGEQQLLAIARCLISEPDLILLDEPTEGIQPSIVDRIIELLRDLNRRHGVTVVIVEQNLDFITELSHRVLLLRKGVISGEVKGSDATDPGLIEEFTGFGGEVGTPAATAAIASRAATRPEAAESPAPAVAARGAPPPPQPVFGSGSMDSAPRLRGDRLRGSDGIGRSGVHRADHHSRFRGDDGQAQFRSSPRRWESNQSPPAIPPERVDRSLMPPRPATAPAPAGATSGASAAPHRPAPVLNERIFYMTAQRPTHAQLTEIVAELGMHMSDARIQEFLDVMQGTLDAYDVVDALPDYLPPVLYPRTAGHRPSPEQNPLNAWYVKTEVRGAPRGPLHGRTVALKDNVCLAGVPMMNGASTLKGYTPDVDATVVTRLLDAGATIVGKAHCEYFCLSGGSHTGAAGPVENPHKAGYSAGGSSSGSAALVGGGFVDMAIGGDQGGSIRIPSSYSGCYGMKPTHGLVPYTGIMPIEATIDITGPMTQNVLDNAVMLQAIAGADGLDPRQVHPQVDDYVAAVGRGVGGMRIGVVKEGFGHPVSEADVDGRVRAGAETFKRLGATVDDVSIPAHLQGLAIWTPIALEGLTNQMMHGNGMGTGWKGMYTTSLLDFHAHWRSRADELSDTLKICMFMGQYYLKHHRGHYYAKAQNLARQLREEYDRVLGAYDLLLMPTLPMKATPLPPRDASLALYCQRAFEMLLNTAPFSVTGHPAMSIPCGMSDGLPVGMMLVGGNWREAVIYRAAAAFEQAGDWRGT